MNIKAVITTLVLGSSSVAMADHKPEASFSAEATLSFGLGDRPVVRDHRPVVVKPAPVYVQPSYRMHYEPFFNPTNTRVTASGSTYIGTFGTRGLSVQRHNWYRPAAWFNLTEPTRIDNNREFFNLHEQAGRFTKIALQGVGGRTEIRQVAIEYRVHGRTDTQKVRLDRMLDRNGSVTIDLAGDSRDIQRIIVYGDSGRGSAYRILAL